MDTAAWYRYFADVEAKGSSPRYERLANGVASDLELLKLLDELPTRRRQSNLLFATVQFLGGPTETWAAFREYVSVCWDEVSSIMLARTTQTNEVARCGTLVPALATLRHPIALIEVGASAGLCLFPDRYAYSYNGKVLGDSELLIPVECTGPVPIPTMLPEIAWRRGIDLNPLDVTNSEDMDWLRACIWPEHDERRERLQRAIVIAAEDPPILIRGDLIDNIEGVLATAPEGLTKVVFHSAVMNYLNAEARERFTSLMLSRDDVVWLSNEGPQIVPGLVSDRKPPVDNSFLLGLNGSSSLAFADPHGRWLSWLPSD